MTRHIIQTAYGAVEGICREDYDTYFGIPYAKPPVGELRWRAPEKPEKWDGVYKADHFGNICYQTLPTEELPVTGKYKKEFYSDPAFIPPMSEDCLNLNIWVPHHAEEEKLPVAFWIHGGGFSGGYNSEIEFDGEAYCKKGVILVTVNYRLGVFGFLAHPWLSAENERGISGNYGCLDQIAALHWVYENIAAFGGDPQNITIFGQSAGSMSTQVLVSSELTGEIPAKAILQSGISCKEEILYTPTLKEAEETGEKFTACTGVKDLAGLRALSPQQIMDYKEKFDAEMWSSGRGIVLVPNVDGYVLKDTVKQIWEQGKMKPIPYMAGCVTNDLGAIPEDVQADRPGLLLEECKRWSLKSEETGGRPAYLYFFSHRLPGDDWGAFHSSELWYTFGTLRRCWRPMKSGDYELSEEMVTCWTNFMKTGNPMSDETEEWKPYGIGSDYVRKFF